MMDEDLRPQRGCFLTGLLVIIMIYSILSIIGSIILLGGGQNLELVQLGVTPQALIIGMVIGAINIAATILILMWKKIGVYMYAGVAIVSFIIGLFTAPELSLIIIIGTILSLVISLLIAYFSYKTIMKREEFDAQE